MSTAECEGCLKEVHAIDLELTSIVHDSSIWLCDDCRREIKANKEQQEGGE